MIDSKLKTERLEDTKSNNDIVGGGNGYLREVITPKGRFYDEGGNNFATTSHLRSQSGSFIFPQNVNITTPNK